MVNPLNILRTNFTGRAAAVKAAQGGAGFDNPRENIDPHVKTKVIDTKEIVQSGVSYDLSTLGGGGVNWFTSGADVIFPQANKSFSGANIYGNNISGNFIWGDGSNLTGLITTESDPIFTGWSGAFTQLSGSFVQLSGQFVSLSAAHYVTDTKLTNLSGAFTQLSGSYVQLSGQHVSLSGAYYTHAADASNPHGGVLTQTGIVSSGIISAATIYATGMISGATISGGDIRVLDDHDTSGAYVVNIVYRASNNPPTASTVPIGTLFIQYNI